MLAVIDNYDSFTYNLVQLVRELGYPVKVYRNNAISLATLRDPQFTGILLSPGPGRPEEAGICLEVVRQFSGRIPILGVCLGHQTIAQAWGGKVVPAARLMHGKTSTILHDGRGIYRDIVSPFTATRYHSLAVEEASLPPCLTISARTPEGEVMGLRHNQFPVEGVQYHPESFATTQGKALLRNFLNLCKT
ncbi:anthranilate synthase component II [Desulforamulus ferrireducens]|uniref:Aminodeoxychorismate/anthranilate synthase component II n=1 Tax=Desulforamulus ferrireducens TaxID=1833852 RepID=A0A1S6IYA7_9FIRM|nr:aminodeoxychorismate/anthranilate synthase component II [Desulforamulus ferrireducens]AQS59730.1 aminodeoxychorismate/anthranilate synthase component II [Desulforamulus ferrireducens]